MSGCKLCDKPCRGEYCSKDCQANWELWCWVLDRDNRREERREEGEIQPREPPGLANTPPDARGGCFGCLWSPMFALSDCDPSRAISLCDSSRSWL